MQYTISHRELSALARVQEVLLDPLSHPDFQTWSRACMDAWIPLVGADSAFMAVPDGTDLTDALGSDPRLGGALESYRAYYWQTDLALGRRWVEEGRPLVHHRDELYRPGDMRRDELYHDWCVPHRLFDTLGIGFDVSGIVPALLNCYREREDGRRLLLERGKALAEVVAPAFRAGARAWLGARGLSRTLGRLVDGLDRGVLLFDACGRLIHSNPRALELLEDAVTGGDVRSSADAIARAVLATGAGEAGTGFSAKVGTVRLDGVRLGASPAAPGVHAAVFLEGPAAALPDVADLTRRHGLTARQAEVALLLADRLSDKEIAKRLGIRLNTARRHSDAVLTRLGLHSRRDVGAALREAAGSVRELAG